MPTNEANTEFETQPLTAQAKKENDENNLKSYKFFCAFHSLNHCFISSERWFLVSCIFLV